MSLPRIAIQICTYNRYAEIKKTVEALQKFLIYPKELVTLYVCDDATPGSYISRLKKLSLFKYWETQFIVSTDAEGNPTNLGWGGNVNNGLEIIEEDYIFFIEDDYVLEAPLDLRLGVALLETKQNLLGMVRYRGSAGGKYLYHQFETDISQFAGELENDPWFEAARTVPYKLTYLQFDRASQTLYIYSHGPHLKHKRFHHVYGKYPVGKKLGETEESFAHTVKNRMFKDPKGSPGIAILPEWVPMRFDHIGKSFQHSKDDN